MTRSQTLCMVVGGDLDQAQAVLDYLQVNRHASVMDMRESGLDVPHGIMRRLHIYGLVDRHSRNSKGHVIWKLM